jgi:hypothetical protein
VRQNYKKVSARSAAGIAEVQKVQDMVFAIDANMASIDALGAEREHLLDTLPALTEANQAAVTQIAHQQSVAQAAEKDWVASLGRRPGWVPFVVKNGVVAFSSVSSSIPSPSSATERTI